MKTIRSARSSIWDAMRHDTPFVLLFCLLLFRLDCLSAQTPHAQLLLKCVPSLQVAHSKFSKTGQAKMERYDLVVNDLPGFVSWAQTYKIPLIRIYAPASIVVVEASEADFFEKILSHSAVQFADRSAVVGQEELRVPGQNLFVNRINAVHERWPLLDGTGITASVKEFRFDSSDVDLRGRYQPSPKSAAQLTIHSNIIASLLAGAGNSEPAGRGVASGVQLVSSNFAGLLPDGPADYLAYNTTVQNHSYGIAIENYYGPLALAYDQSVVLRPTLLHVFSAGNDGLKAAPSGTYANLTGFSNLTGNFKMAKNVLTVGSVDSFGQIPPLSSRGPAYDGRIKPDLVAFGPGGTSEAAALVSGAAAVLQQAFLEKYNSLPAANVLRAVLLNTADDIAPPGPDFTSGFGNLNLKNALQSIQNQQLEFGAVAASEMRTFPLEIPLNARNLRIALAWDELSALPGAAIALLNDLDLEVRSADGSVWQPWVLNTAPHPDSLRQPARRGRDSLNNVEQISLDFPLPGWYQVQVRGYRVATSQSFSLAFDWDTLHHFEWDCPVRNDPAIAGKEAILRWTTNLTDSIGKMEWRTVGSADWQLMDPAASVAAGFRRWLVPDTFAAIQVRMVADGQSFVSDTFLIAPELRMRVGFNCPDSVLLRWNGAGPGATYQLWGLGDRYMEPLLTTADTFLVLLKKDFPQPRFTVSALGPGGVRTPKSVAPDIATQGVGCYISNLLALLNEDGGVDLTLDLGSLYQVQKVFLEKWKNGMWETLYEEIPSVLQVTFTDKSPSAGANTYRARLQLENGGEIVGDGITIFSPGPSGYLLLPNPVDQGQGVTLLARQSDETSRFFLFDLLGRLLMETALEGEQTQIDLSPLQSGYYVWQITSAPGKSLAKRAMGRLIVH